MGRLQFVRSRYEAAERLLLKAVDHPRFSFSSWLTLAKIAFLHGRVNQGRHRLLRALAANPRKFSKVRRGWVTLSPLWISPQPNENLLFSGEDGTKGQDSWGEEGWEQETVVGPSLPSMDSEESLFDSSSGPYPPQEPDFPEVFSSELFSLVDDCEEEEPDEDELLPFERPDGTFSQSGFIEYFFGFTLDDEDEDDEDDEDEELEEGLGEDETNSWEFTEGWDANWGSFLHDELFSRFSEEEEKEESIGDPDAWKDDSRAGRSREDAETPDENEKDRILSEAQYWERFLKNPEFSTPHEARKFSLLPPIRHSEFRNLDWSYLQSRLFPKGGMPEEGAGGRS